MNYLDLIADFIEQPKAAALAASVERPFGLAVFCFLFAGISLYLAQSVGGRLHFLSFGVFSLLLVCVWQILGSLLLAAVLHLLVELSESRSVHPGNAAGLWVLLGMCD